MVDSEGRRHTGANVENAAYGSSICAEATAIAGAVARGVRRIEGVVVACVERRRGGMTPIPAGTAGSS